MKKKGTALATVLIVTTALLIIGTAVSAAVINTTKFNARYSDNIDLELAAKSGLNIAREDFISKAIGIDAINEYVFNRSEIDQIYNNSTGIEVDISIDKRISEKKIVIRSIAKDRLNNTASKTAEQVINLKVENNSGGESSGDLTEIFNKKVSLIISSQNNILDLDHVNGGILTCDNNTVYDSYSKSQGGYNQNDNNKYNVDISIGNIKLTNEKTETIYVSNEGIISNPQHNTDCYKIYMNSGKYEVIDNISGFIVIIANGDLTIEGNYTPINTNKKILFVVNGKVTLKSYNNSELIMNSMAIMAKEVMVANNQTAKIAFNSGLIVTNKLNLPNGYISSTLSDTDYSNAIRIMDKVIKNQSLI